MINNEQSYSFRQSPKQVKAGRAKYEWSSSGPITTVVMTLFQALLQSGLHHHRHWAIGIGRHVVPSSALKVSLSPRQSTPQQFFHPSISDWFWEVVIIPMNNGIRAQGCRTVCPLTAADFVDNSRSKSAPGEWRQQRSWRKDGKSCCTILLRLSYYSTSESVSMIRCSYQHARENKKRASSRNISQFVWHYATSHAEHSTKRAIESKTRKPTK